MAAAPPAGHFTVLYFASANSFTRRESDVLPAPLRVDRLFDTLEARYPGFKAKVLVSCLVTVNLDYVDVDGLDSTEDNKVLGIDATGIADIKEIQEGDEVAIIPPVSSG